jgi:hypothetical protein
VCGNFIHDGHVEAVAAGRARVIFVGTSGEQQYTRSATASGQMYEVQLSNPGGLFISNLPMEIKSTGRFIFDQGIVRTTASNQLDVFNTDPGAIVGYGPTAFVNGRLHRAMLTTPASYSFPVGYGTTYRLAMMDFQENHGYTDLLVRYNNITPISYPTMPGVQCGTPPTTPPVYIDLGGQWEVTPTPASPLNKGRYHFMGNMYGMSVPAGISTIIKMPSAAGGAGWGLDGGCGAVSGTIVPRYNITSGFSDFKVVQKTDPTPFPVELLGIKATPLTDHIEVSWMTATETNNLGFEVHRSVTPDAEETWQNIGWVAGHGTSSEAHSYQLKDYEVEFNRPYFYRVRQLDQNGSAKWSTVVEAQLTNTTPMDVQVYPNPTKGEVYLRIRALDDEKVTLKVVNSIGQTILSDELKVVNGTVNHLVDLARYATGTYSVVLTTAQGVFVEKVIKH